MSDPLHTHLTIGLRPVGECPACDQVRDVLAGATTGSYA
jgi:hypothetical protein